MAGLPELSPPIREDNSGSIARHYAYVPLIYADAQASPIGIPNSEAYTATNDVRQRAWAFAGE